MKEYSTIPKRIFDTSKKLTIFVGENGAFKSYYARSVRSADSKGACMYNNKRTIYNGGIYYHLAELIEAEVLNGRIVDSNDLTPMFYSNRKYAACELTSHGHGSVRSLMLLVCYLKHDAKFNDLVLIEEPEQGLHPASQIMLARIFATMINNGLRLLITTHSDYIIREINNLIKISANQDTKDVAEKLGYVDNQYINKDNIAVYEFKFKDKSSANAQVEHIKIDEFGFNVSTFDDTIDKLNNAHLELCSVLKYWSNNEQV
jgi:predicted ATPase